MKILVTGCAGFIGMHTSQYLLNQGHEVVGIDNLNDYYSPQLKLDRLKQIQNLAGFSFQKMDIVDADAINRLFADNAFDRVVHLAAQAGVRYSIINPKAYIDSNITGFLNILEACRHNQIEHLVYASSSSVYGKNTKLPYSESDQVDHPVSLYAATKKSNELMAYSYSHLYGFASTGLRFFTVYGPWGRPDMSPYIFIKAILEGKPIQLFNYGDMNRDFTYIDDIVRGVVEVLAKPASKEKDNNLHRVFNIGNHQPVQLTEYVKVMEVAAGVPAIIELAPMQAGDVLSTYADTELIERVTNFKPSTPLSEGLKCFVNWYKDYHNISS
jgi:UDP-glucuronate 4-epimerase